jgi:hypothetical protein
MTCPRRPLAPRLLAGAAVALALLAAAPPAPAEGAPIVDLYTIGVGHDVLSAFGHSVLCLTRDAARGATCYDFGVPDVQDAITLVWGSVRGEPHFIPRAVAEERFVAVFAGQDRTLWRQRLPLAPDEAEAVAAKLEAAVASKAAYAYHPHHQNCTTKLRDILDEATHGKLRAERSAPSDGKTYRTMMEEGFSGRVPELAALALVAGSMSDRVPSAYEGMAVPARLMAEVEARFGVAPEKVHERFAPPLPTSPLAGRIVLVALGALLAAALVWTSRSPSVKHRVARHAAGVILGVAALFALVAAAVGTYPELGRNWVFAAALPTDLALGFLPGPWRARYVAARLAGLALLLVASLSGLVAQPLASIVAFVALPIAAVGLSDRRAARVA